MVKTLPYVINDTIDFLCRLKEVGDIPGGTIICSMDVVSLYPHISHDEGLESMRSVLNEYNRDIGNDGELPVEDLIDLAELILKNNYFEFEDKIYHQMLGTTIGTKFIPPFANIFMSKLKERMLSEYHLVPLVWWRFLDDVFLIWLHGKEILLEFLNFVNGYHPCIKYTWEWSIKRLSYLDVMILVEDGRILTDVYSKPTDTHQYLHYESCHPAHETCM